MAAGNLAVDPVMQLATIGVLGVLDPKAALGDLMTPIISIAVVVILLEGGLTLNFHQLSDASQCVKRLVLVGASLGWITSTLALHYVVGVSWAVLGCVWRDHDCHRSNGDCAAVATGETIPSSRGFASMGGHCERSHRRTGSGSGL